MSAQRKRKRLVPEDAVEMFELRVVRYFDSEGDPYIRIHASSPDDPNYKPELTDVMGALTTAILIWWDEENRIGGS